MVAMDTPVTLYVLALHRKALCAHLVADNPDELHAMAECLGLQPAWFQGGRMPHYDLMGSKVAEARRLGVPVVGRREVLKMARACVDASPTVAGGCVS